MLIARLLAPSSSRRLSPTTGISVCGLDNTDPEKIEARPKCFIKFIPGRTNPAVKIEDYGIGMMKYVLAHNLGAIARIQFPWRP